MSRPRSNQHVRDGATAEEGTVLSGEFIGAARKSEGELLANLSTLSTFLSECSDDEDKGKFAVISAALVQDSLLKHKNGDVRLMVALCIASVLRLYAPEVPYVETHLKKIFKVFLEQLAGLENPGHSSSAHLAVLLERIASVKAVVIFLDYAELIVRLFRLVFQVVHSEHPQMVVIHMMDMLIACIEESDSVPPELLDVLLVQLLPSVDLTASPSQQSDATDTQLADREGGRDGAENPSAKLLAQQVIQHASQQLEPAISKLLLDSVAGCASHSELQNHYHELIWELFSISPSLTYKVLPELSEELKSENVELRTKVVGLLSKVFAAPDLDAVFKFYQLFDQFLHRYDDIDKNLRIAMVAFGGDYLTRAETESGVLPVNAGLLRRLRDADEDVRRAALSAVCEVALSEKAAFRLEKKTLQQAILRIRDRKSTIRMAALIAATRMLVFAETEMAKLQRKTSTIGEEGDTAWRRWQQLYVAAYSCIPSNVLLCYATGTLTDQAAAEELFFKILSSRATLDDVSERKGSAIRLVQVVTDFDSGATKCFSKLMNDKLLFRRDVLQWLQSKTPQMTLRVASRVPKHSTANSHELLKKFVAQCDDGLLRLLMTVATPEAPYPSVKRALRQLQQRFESCRGWKSSRIWTTFKDLVYILTQHLSFPFVTPAGVHHLIVWLRDVAVREPEEPAADDADRAIRSVGRRMKKKNDEPTTIRRCFLQSNLSKDRLVAAISLILDHASQCLPGYFSPHLDDLMSLLAAPDPNVVDAAVKIAAQVLPSSAEHRHNPAVDSGVREPLVELLTNGNPKQASYAAKGLSKLLADDREQLSAVVQKLIQTAISEHVGSQATAFSALTEFLEVEDAIPDGDCLCRHVLDTLLPATATTLKRAKKSSATTARVSPPVEDQISSLALSKAEGLLFAASYLSRRAERDRSAASRRGDDYNWLKRLVDDLFALLDEPGVDADIQYVQATAVSALIRLAVNRACDAIISLRHLQKLAQLARHAPELVRTSLRAALFKGLMNLKGLTLKYLALYPFFHASSRRSEARREFQRCVELRRHFATGRMTEMLANEADALDLKASKAFCLVVPEYALPWLVHLLGHVDDFPDADLPSFARTVECLQFFLHGVTRDYDNYEFLLHMLSDIKQTYDAQAPESHNVQMVAELGILLVQQRPVSNLGKRSVRAGAIFLPKQLFKVCGAPDERAPRLLSADARYLPEDFKLPSAGSRTNVLSSMATGNRRKKRCHSDRLERSIADVAGDSTYDDDDDDDSLGQDDDDDKESAPIQDEGPAKTRLSAKERCSIGDSLASSMEGSSSSSR